jgi:hypothetical protein
MPSATHDDEGEKDAGLRRCKHHLIHPGEDRGVPRANTLVEHVAARNLMNGPLG